MYSREVNLPFSVTLSENLNFAPHQLERYDSDMFYKAETDLLLLPRRLEKIETDVRLQLPANMEVRIVETRRLRQFGVNCVSKALSRGRSDRLLSFNFCLWNGNVTPVAIPQHFPIIEVRDWQYPFSKDK